MADEERETSVSADELGPGGEQERMSSLSAAATASTSTNNASSSVVDVAVRKEYAVTAEYSLLVNDPLDGMYIVPTYNNPFEWAGLLFIRRGIYQGGIFRFIVKLPDDFPDTQQLPRIIFNIPIFHPSVDPNTNQLDLQKYFPAGWKSGVHHVYHALVVMQRAFSRIDILNKVNTEAHELYEKDKKAFRLKAEASVKKSRELAYDVPETADPHVIRFSPWDPAVHDGIKQRIYNSDKPMGPTNCPDTPGRSWVDVEHFVLMSGHQ